MVATDWVRFLFADARALYDDAIEMLDQGKIRNAAEKAWGTTKRATGARVQYNTRSALLHVNCEPEQVVRGLSPSGRGNL